MLICEFCKSNSVVFLKDTEFLKKKTSLYLCKCCGHVFKEGVFDITSRDLVDFYKDIEYNHDAIIEKQHKKQLLFINKFTPSIPAKVLEIGGGLHGLIKRFDNHVQKYALELNSNTHKDIEKHGAVVINNLDDIGQKFGLIILSHVFEHIFDDSYEYINKLLGLLEEDGCLFIEVPHISYELFIKGDEVLFDNLAPSHLKSDSPSSYIQFLESFNKKFIIESNVNLFWKVILFFRNSYYSSSKLFFHKLIYLFPAKVLSRIRYTLKLPNPNIKIIIYNASLDENKPTARCGSCVF